ncbi:MAG: hypothetical protein IPG69_02845 [Flavobacteriales bacterium]|nr:hypothetical protein [Flavobacteriales bacterium]
MKQALFRPATPDQVYSIDARTLWDGRTYRLLNVIDDYNREVLAIEVDTSLQALRVIAYWRSMSVRPLPKMIRGQRPGVRQPQALINGAG